VTEVGGSSPLARGLLICGHGARVQPGIIPARAGFTPCTATRSPPGSDHPRSRGVYHPVPPGRLPVEGSSPLARGLPRNVGRPPRNMRIIPARAGFTARMAARQAGRRDHPRSRGVYSWDVVSEHILPGSSPLARGLLKRAPGRACTARIIPARAGFTQRVRGHEARRPDHPRSRGVYSKRNRKAFRASGSSPLARGLRRGRRGR